MFFFIGGVNPRTVTLERQPRTCSICGRLALYLKRMDHYLSLFFIPLFPVKRGKPFLSCAGCGAVFDEHGGERREEQIFRARVCPSCGRQRELNFKYCPECGKPVKYGRQT